MIWFAPAPTSGPTVPVTDCTTTPCEGPDMDPVAGQFKIENLEWGGYTLTETKAPPGYQVGSSASFTIGAGDDLNITLASIVNTKVTGPTLPMTGGQSAALFTILGGGLLAGALALTAMNRRKGGAAHRA